MKSAAQSLVPRPELTMPGQEADALRSAYEDARTILEYGSGGSTVLAADMPGKKVISVESDKDWAQMMRRYFRQNPPRSEVDIIWSDIGPTREWGHPRTHEAWRRYARYPLEVWELEEFIHPDVVLVDGRFRVGCALATAFRISRPVTLLFDDYVRRENYHVIESYVGAPEIIGRMARFRITPQQIPAERLLQITELMTRP